MRLSSITLVAKRERNIKKPNETNIFFSPKLDIFKDYGYITEVGAGIAEAMGLFGAKAGELVRIHPYGISALVFNLKVNRVGLVLCSVNLLEKISPITEFTINLFW